MWAALNGVAALRPRHLILPPPSVGGEGRRYAVAMADLPARSQLVRDRLREEGIEGEIIVLPDAASTAPLAAAALGVEVGAIAR